MHRSHRLVRLVSILVLGGFALGVCFVALTPGVETLAASARYSGSVGPQLRALEDPTTKKLLAEVAKEAFGRPLRVVLKTGPPADGDLGMAAREIPKATIARERATSRAEDDPVVRSAMELFRAELTDVKEEE